MAWSANNLLLVASLLLVRTGTPTSSSFLFLSGLLRIHHPLGVLTAFFAKSHPDAADLITWPVDPPMSHLRTKESHGRGGVFSGP